MTFFETKSCHVRTSCLDHVSQSQAVMNRTGIAVTLFYLTPFPCVIIENNVKIRTILLHCSKSVGQLTFEYYYVTVGKSFYEQLCQQCQQKV